MPKPIYSAVSLTEASNLAIYLESNLASNLAKQFAINVASNQSSQRLSSRFEGNSNNQIDIGDRHHKRKIFLMHRLEVARNFFDDLVWNTDVLTIDEPLVRLTIAFAEHLLG